MLLYFLQRLTAMRKCRNWQTSKTKDLVVAIPCGFKSHLPQEILKALSFQGFFYFIGICLKERASRYLRSSADEKEYQLFNFTNRFKKHTLEMISVDEKVVVGLE